MVNVQQGPLPNRVDFCFDHGSDALPEVSPPPDVHDAAASQLKRLNVETSMHHVFETCVPGLPVSASVHRAHHFVSFSAVNPPPSPNTNDHHH